MELNLKIQNQTGLHAVLKLPNYLYYDMWSSLHQLQKEMLMSEEYGRLHQAAYLGNQYMCFNCMKSCPVGLHVRH